MPPDRDKARRDNAEPAADIPLGTPNLGVVIGIPRSPGETRKKDDEGRVADEAAKEDDEREPRRP
jgi:hypothetical protein